MSLTKIDAPALDKEAALAARLALIQAALARPREVLEAVEYLEDFPGATAEAIAGLVQLERWVLALRTDG